MSKPLIEKLGLKELVAMGVGGMVGGASLAGVRFVVTFEMGKWTRLYVDESMSDAQIAAYERIMPLVITSYSIHYTKLYDFRVGRQRRQ